MRLADATLLSQKWGLHDFHKLYKPSKWLPEYFFKHYHIELRPNITWDLIQAETLAFCNIGSECAVKSFCYGIEYTQKLDFHI